MEFKILPIIAFLSVAIVVSHAALPSEEYWNSVLPNTPMPKAVKDLLQPTPAKIRQVTTYNAASDNGNQLLVWGWKDDSASASASASANGNQLLVWGRKDDSASATANGNQLLVWGRKDDSASATANGNQLFVWGWKDDSASASATANGNQLFVWGWKDDSASASATANGNQLFVWGWKDDSASASASASANGNHLHDDPNVDIFFLERDLFAGNKMNTRLSQSTKNQQTFLPRQLADSIPFSSEKLPAIFSELHVKPASAEAAAIKKTIQICEGGDTLKGEEKFCATSLESMIDFSTAVLGKKVSAVSTEADGGGGERKAYRVAAVKRLAGPEAASVSCHQMEYPYAVFYCHKIDASVAYSVSLVGGGGAKAEAVAVCHRDTSEWNPKHLAFQVLKVKPGTFPVCHYLPDNHIVWVSKN